MCGCVSSLGLVMSKVDTTPLRAACLAENRLRLGQAQSDTKVGLTVGLLCRRRRGPGALPAQCPPPVVEFFRGTSKTLYSSSLSRNPGMMTSSK